MAQDRVLRWTVMNTVINIRGPYIHVGTEYEYCIDHQFLTKDTVF
jgi:hypothetical protein